MSKTIQDISFVEGAIRPSICSSSSYHVLFKVSLEIDFELYKSRLSTEMPRKYRLFKLTEYFRP